MKALLEAYLGQEIKSYDFDQYRYNDIYRPYNDGVIHEIRTDLGQPHYKCELVSGKTKEVYIDDLLEFLFSKITNK